MGASYATLAEVEGVSRSAIGKSVSTLLTHPGEYFFPREHRKLSVPEAKQAMLLYYANLDMVSVVDYSEAARRLSRMLQITRKKTKR